MFAFFHLATAQRMAVRDCASLDDHALSALSKRGSKGAELPCMYGLCDLEISGCTVSFAGIKKMIIDRQDNARAAGVPFEGEGNSGPYGCEAPPITSLNIVAGSALALSEQEEEWLRDNVAEFSYTITPS